jgi:N-methylhydantoinase B/oxoprolinase/acetone carboxylase alpha subunit
MLNKKAFVGMTLVIVVGLGVGLWSTSTADNLSTNTPNDQAQIIIDDSDNNSILVGGHPGSCGYVWDRDREGWHRPWDPDSFISAEDKPEWQTFIPVIEEPQNDVFVGGTPGSCGYMWDEERGGWHRPWDANSFILAEEKPEWEQYIP